MGKFVESVAFYICYLIILRTSKPWSFEGEVNTHILCLSHFMDQVQQSWLQNHWELIYHQELEACVFSIHHKYLLYNNSVNHSLENWLVGSISRHYSGNIGGYKGSLAWTLTWLCQWVQWSVVNIGINIRSFKQSAMWQMSKSHCALER